MRILIPVLISFLFLNCSSYKNSTKSYETYKKGIVPKSNEDLVWQDYLKKVEISEIEKAKQKKIRDSILETSKNSKLVKNIINKEQNGELIFIESQPKFLINNKNVVLSEFITEHILKNFNYPNFAMEYDMEGRVTVNFEINKEGIVSNIYANGPKNGLILEQEAIRIISLLPKAIEPGIQKGNPVIVSFAIPITFKLQ